MAQRDNNIDFPSRLGKAIRAPLFLALAVLWLALGGMEAARPCYCLHDDNATWFSGAYLHDFRVLTETGRLAEINYYQHGGEPFLEQGQTAVLYPPIYLGEALAKLLPGDARYALDWIAALHLTLALLGFYFWMRHGGMPPHFAALGALIWVFNPFVLVIGVSWIFATFTAAWLPWLFWAFDYLLVRPSGRAALFLGTVAGLFFLQGYVQWFAYAILFLGLYALFQFVTRREIRRPVILYYLSVAALFAFILALPMLLPMLHALQNSAQRAGPMPTDAALFYSLNFHQIISAQVCFFGGSLMFGLSAVILYCPAMMLLPVMALRFYYSDAEMRRRLFPLIFLGLLAIVFSTDWHIVLTKLPLFDRFRWPFKVFLMADFFLIVALVWTAFSWTQSRRSPRKMKFIATVCLIVVALANVSISISAHDGNAISQTTLPATVQPVLPSMDSQLGRVVTLADYVPESLNALDLTHAYATYFAFPSVGGYNPLVGADQIDYALRLEFPNFCTQPLTPDLRKQLESRSVRYWIIDSHSSQAKKWQSLPGLKTLESTPGRIVLEDTQSPPLVYSTANPIVPCVMTYSGNSMLISLKDATSPVFVSLAPTDGWWYRVDHGPWVKARYENLGLIIPFDTPSNQLEVSYFDSRFHQARILSVALLLLLMPLLLAGHRVRKKL
jgi:hypothetical protein